MKLTVTQQIVNDVFKPKSKKKHHNGTSLDEQLVSSAKKNLLQKIDFVDSQKPFSMNLNKLKNKYVLLNPTQENAIKKSLVNGAKHSKGNTGNSNDGIPAAKYILFSSDRVECKWKSSMRVGAGLANLGNTCFLNSALQCLTYTPPLANYMLFASHKNHCKFNGQQFCMLCALQHHINVALNNGGQSIRPMSILKNLRSIARHMHFGRQEDAHEFIRYSVDAMQKSCLYGHSNKLDMHTKATTLVHRVFGGYLRSRVKCRQCKAVSDTFDPFLDVSLDINKQGCSDLRRCLENFVSPEILHGDNAYRCLSCKNNVSASKTFSIHRPPNVLTVQLKRFSSFMGNKINKDVTYPSKLNLGPYSSSSCKDGPWYGLYAVLVHSGFSCQSGHYYAYAKAANGLWYCFNDSSVHQVSANQALSQQAYLLFYHKVAESTKSITNESKKVMTSTTAQDPIPNVKNKEVAPKPISTNGLKVTSINPNREESVKIHPVTKLTKTHVSFQVKSFSNLPHHQKHWRKIHCQKPRDHSIPSGMINGTHKVAEDDNSSSSSDSRRSEKEKSIYAKKLKILGKHKLSDDGSSDKKDNTSVPLKKIKSNSNVDFSPGKNNVSHHTNETNSHCPPTKKRWDEKVSVDVSEEATKRRNTLSKLFEQSSSRAYGANVPTWDGQESVVEKDARKDYFANRHSKIDNWDREYDRGRSKKTKAKHRNNNANENMFQKFQKYHTGSALNSY